MFILVSVIGIWEIVLGKWTLTLELRNFIGTVGKNIIRLVGYTCEVWLQNMVSFLTVIWSFRILYTYLYITYGKVIIRFRMWLNFFTFYVILCPKLGHRIFVMNFPNSNVCLKWERSVTTSWGLIDLVILNASSTSGFPTWMSRYFKYQTGSASVTTFEFASTIFFIWKKMQLLKFFLTLLGVEYNTHAHTSSL